VDAPLVVVTSGTTEVATRRLATLRGVHTARLADPETVVDIVGYEIGSVPPFCHDQSVPVYLDETLTEFQTVWAAAGTPTAVFPIEPDTLIECAEATVVDIAK
jgi:prolyl-tRNA editing enzyme YbaK/EbsC (Cys-tRNA(Pro) deacylase)